MTSDRQSSSRLASLLIRGVTANGLSSLATFALSLSLARSLTLNEYGLFTLALAAFVFATGAVRSALLEPLLATLAARSAFRNDVLESLSGLSLLLSLLFVAVGATGIAQNYLIPLGLSLHGAVLYEAWRLPLVAQGRAKPVLAVESIRLSLVAGSLAVSIWTPGLSLLPLYVWAVTFPMIAYPISLRRRLSLRPRLTFQPFGSQVGYFLADYCAGAGSGQLSQYALGAAAGPSAAGSVRVGATLLTPVSLLSASASSIVVTTLARSASHGRKNLRAVTFRLAVLQMTGVVILAAVACLTAPILGPLAFGDNWTESARLFPWLVIEVCLVASASLPFAGHRALLAGRQSLAARVVLAVVRLGLVGVGAYLFGAEGAVVAMTFVALLSAVTWWLSYHRLMVRLEAE